jgi:hypothetical protein
MGIMRESVNWLLLLIGAVGGGLIGIYIEKARIWYHRTRAGMRLAMPAMKLAGGLAIGLIAVLGVGLAVMGVL